MIKGRVFPYLKKALFVLKRAIEESLDRFEVDRIRKGDLKKKKKERGFDRKLLSCVYRIEIM